MKSNKIVFSLVMMCCVGVLPPWAQADEGPWERLGQKKPNPKDLSKPYQQRSLKNLSNADIVRYMGDGKNMRELEYALILKTHVPTNFWQRPPKLLALAFAEENRYPDHRKLYRLSLDDSDGQKPPEVCSLAFTDESDKSYSAVDRHYFLRVDPARSYLAYARSWEGGAVFYNAVHNAPAFDFRFCELSYADAKQIADTVWWLNRIHSKSLVSSFGFIHCGSSADGFGSLVMRNDDGQVAVRIHETLWPFSVPERWWSDYSPEIGLNLASYLLENALPERLGGRWSRFEPKKLQDSLARETGAPQYGTNEVRRILMWAGDFLDLFKPDQKAVSFAIVQEAARAAGEFADAHQLARLERVREQLKLLPVPGRTRQQIEAEIDKLRGESGESAATAEKQLELYRELEKFNGETEGAEVESSVALALKKIRLADDVQALRRWACTQEEGSQWALQRLSEKDRKQYVAALEWWMANSKEKWARQAFDAIAQEDAKRAEQIAGSVAPDKKDDLSVLAFARLKEAGAIPDEKKRVDTLIQIALDPKSGWEERGEAVQLLVPADQPLSYPDKAIDEALVRLFDPKLGDATVNFTLSDACRALARRGRVEHFEQMTKLLEAADMSSYGDLLGPVVQMAQCAPQVCNKTLEAALKPELTLTGRSVTDVLLAIWAADLRSLEPEVRRLATSSPEDYEDERAGCYCSEKSPVEGRFHLARQILALWNEESLVTKCRLLIAFGYQRVYDFVGEAEEERLTRMKRELAVMERKLNVEQKREVSEFLTWCQAQQMPEKESRASRELVEKFTALVKSGLSLPVPTRTL